MRDEEGAETQHKGRCPPRHRQQEVARRGEHQREQQPPAFPGDRMRQRGNGEQHRGARFDRGLQRELAGQLGARGPAQGGDDQKGPVAGSDDRGRHPQQPGSPVCVR
jgi:hypothetical protein